MELPFDPAIPLLGLYPENPETLIQKNQCSPMFIAAMEYYAAERKKELLPFETARVDLESIMLSEISQAVRDKYHMISPLTGT